MHFCETYPQKKQQLAKTLTNSQNHRYHHYPELEDKKMATLTAKHQITWEKLPEDFILSDDTVTNINQPALAAALTDSLEAGGIVTPKTLTITNYGICATLNGKTVVKAPDWGYIANISITREEVIRSYTPQLQGEIPTIVMEFLSDTEGGEYSTKPTYPPGKWFFYEQVLQVPYYAIFESREGALEVYLLDKWKQYQLQKPDNNGRYWIEGMRLYLGVWEGTRERRTGYWLRWWNEDGELLLWSLEKAERERGRAEEEKQRADRLLQQLRAAGLEPEKSGNQRVTSLMRRQNND